MNLSAFILLLAVLALTNCLIPATATATWKRSGAGEETL